MTLRVYYCPTCFDQLSFATDQNEIVFVICMVCKVAHEASVFLENKMEASTCSGLVSVS
jgi:hypothetical protein